MVRWKSVPRRSSLAVLCLVLLLADCSGPGPGRHWGQRSAQGVYKLGQPYEVNGRWYYPEYDPSYDRVGIASWYGDDFNGLQTANGEVFDKDAISAAHTTLPLPSIVRVTNLANGRALDLRVNDRGPFVDGRLIDLSEAAARRLGFEQAGLAKVRVTFLRMADARGAPPSPVMVAQRTPELAPPAAPPPAPAVLPPRELPAPLPQAPAITQRELAAPAAPRPAPVPSGGRAVALADAPPVALLPRAMPALPPRPPAPPVCTQGPQFVQVGNFADTTRVRAAAATLRGLGAVVVQPYFTGSQALARVKLGPFPDFDTALGLLNQVRELGYPEAVVVPATLGRAGPALC